MPSLSKSTKSPSIDGFPNWDGEKLSNFQMSTTVESLMVTKVSFGSNRTITKGLSFDNLGNAGKS
ncbi:MAG: hypothetical protein IIA49_14100 [Bacteroidetes bacterium]|nr:hypothetical protein [Bacteroidota bacterium]